MSLKKTLYVVISLLLCLCLLSLSSCQEAADTSTTSKGDSNTIIIEDSSSAQSEQDNTAVSENNNGITDGNNITDVSSEKTYFDMGIYLLDKDGNPMADTDVLVLNGGIGVFREHTDGKGHLDIGEMPTRTYIELRTFDKSGNIEGLCVIYFIKADEPSVTERDDEGFQDIYKPDNFVKAELEFKLGEKSGGNEFAYLDCTRFVSYETGDIRYEATAKADDEASDDKATAGEDADADENTEDEQSAA